MTQRGISELLAAAGRDDPAAWEQLMALVYDDLKRIAHRQMARIAPGQTLSTTVLVHEAFEKLAGRKQVLSTERTEFYALCACAMRQIIIDHYRKRAALKRAPDDILVLADHEARRANPEADSTITRLGGVLDAMVKRDERMVEVFEMRYFAGLSDDDIARRLDLSPRTVQRIATRARSWIVAALDDDQV